MDFGLNPRKPPCTLNRTLPPRMVPLRKIAFFSLTPSPPAPPANQKTLEALKAEFPDHQFDEFYILPILKQAPAAFATAAAVAGLTYAPQLISGQKKMKYAAFRTAWIFSWIKRQIARQIDPVDYEFSFQMQSIFDASIAGLPHFVYTDHTHLENLNFEGFESSDLYNKRWIDRERTIYQNATKVFTRSSNVTASLVDQYDCDPERIACVYAGSNTTIPEDLSERENRYSSKNILVVGIDWERKGGPTLLEAFKKVLARHPDANLTIVGCAPNIGETPSCNIAGRVPLDDVNRFYDEATVFCLPTRVEPFGIVFVEAMWQSLPIVATRVGAVPDMVEDGVNGYLVSPGDVDELAERLNAVLDSPDRRKKFGTASRKKAERNYDWSMVASRMRDHIEKFIQQSS